jgi:hypothetical protein
MTLLIKSTPTLGQRVGQNLGQTPMSPSRTFVVFLQISPKHSKISQYKSCPVFRGTQLYFWVAL